MDWINDTLINHSAIQATIILAIIITCGTALGKVKMFGVSLGATFVFFVGILAGHLGVNIEPQMLSFAQSFGLVLFVYEIGLEVGPGFVRSFLGSGIKLNAVGMANVMLGTLLAVGLAYALNIPMSDMAGILSGAVTNTPSLAAAQQTLAQLGVDASSAALGCAVTYPLGVVGVILAIVILNKLAFVKTAPKHPANEGAKQPYAATFLVKNPACDGMMLRDITKLTDTKFVISRIWRDDVPADTPTGDSTLKLNDHILVITEEKYIPQLTMLFGLRDESENWNREDINWDKLDGKLMSRNMVITRSEINGRKLGSLRLHNRYRVNVSRINRMGLKLLATPDLRLQYGDRITVVGTAEALDKVEIEMGSKVEALKEPNLASVFVGITLGLMLGYFPIIIPGVSLPVRLGLAGGSIIAGILMGAYGARLRLRTYTTRSANLMLRGIGLSLYLACLGLLSGEHFIETVMRPEGLLWIGLGFVITFVPVVVVATWCIKMMKMDVGSTYGLLCGSMANPMALSYASECIEGDSPSVSYATVYPLSMFMRVVLIQLLLLLLI